MVASLIKQTFDPFKHFLTLSISRNHISVSTDIFILRRTNLYNIILERCFIVKHKYTLLEKFPMKINDIILNEYDASTTDDQLKKEIIGLVQKSDRDTLDRVYQALGSGDFDQRIAAALSQNDDAVMVKDKLAAIIASTKGSFQEKNDFINGFSKGYINVKALLSSTGSLDSYFTGNDFGKRVFLSASSNLVSMGVGPGEVALAAFSPLIKFAGQSRGAGDLIIMDKVAVEVKGKIKSWGRLHDPRKAKYGISVIRDALEKAGIQVGRSFSLPNWLAIRDSLDSKIRQQLANIMVSNLFKFVSPPDAKQFAQQLATGSSDELRISWAALSFDNYQAVSGFDGILFFDAITGATRYIDNSFEISALKVDTPMIVGAEQEIMPKIGF